MRDYTTMCPIPTTYHDVQFRSRLEARWAVFLDALDVRWFYEHEGYQLPSGWYLPDFWLPDLVAFIEIKPTQPTPMEETRCGELSLATRHRVYLFPAEPQEYPGFANRDGLLFSRCRYDDEVMDFDDNGQAFLACHCGRVRLEYGYESNYLTCSDSCLGPDPDRVATAARAANAYRFW